MPILPQEPAIYPSDLLDAPAAEVLAGRVWWAVYTKARQEKALARDLLALKIPFYLPLVSRNLLIRGRRVQSQVPVFTGYLFLFSSTDERHRAFGTNRIVHVLEVPHQLELRHDLRQVRRLIESQAPLTVESRLQAGQRVRVRSGSMAGLEGMVESRRSGTRLIVAVRFLQQGVSLEVDDYQLEPID